MKPISPQAVEDLMEGASQYSLEELRRKRDQEYELAGLADLDGDYEGKARHMSFAKMYDAALTERRA